MKKWLLIFLLAGSAQAACQAHPGYILNGNAVQPTGLQVICGQAYAAYKNGFNGDPNVKWTELYAVKNSANPTELARKLDATFGKLGFVQTQNKAPSATEHIFGYMNTSTRKIVSMYMFVNSSIVYVTLSGN